MASLAVVIVSWNVSTLLRQCVQAVQASLQTANLSYRIVVVDNASSDGTVAMLHREFPDIQVIASPHNLGFAGGNNLALRMLGFADSQHTMPPSHPAVLPDTTPPDMVLLLNPDTEPVGTAIHTMVEYMQSHADVAVVGPQLHYADGTTQSSRRRFPTRLTLLCESTLLERAWPCNPWAQHYRCAESSDAAVQDVDWLVGAALLVRGSAIACAGLLDEHFFMYSEELEWQARLKRCAPSLYPSSSSRRIVYLPSALIIHHEGKSSEQVLARRHIHFQRSKLRLARLWYGPRFALLLWALLQVGYLWEVVVESAKYLLGHRRPLRRQRIGVYLHVVQQLSLLKNRDIHASTNTQ
jgi:GT2 family glycosyltransferase